MRLRHGRGFESRQRGQGDVLRRRATRGDACPSVPRERDRPQRFERARCDQCSGAHGIVRGSEEPDRPIRWGSAVEDRRERHENHLPGGKLWGRDKRPVCQQRETAIGTGLHVEKAQSGGDAPGRIRVAGSEPCRQCRPILEVDLVGENASRRGGGARVGSSGHRHGRRRRPLSQHEDLVGVRSRGDPYAGNELPLPGCLGREIVDEVRLRDLAGKRRGCPAIGGLGRVRPGVRNRRSSLRSILRGLQTRTSVQKEGSGGAQTQAHGDGQPPHPSHL
jgi:hypothetical protein